MTEADLPLLGEHDLDAVHCRILTSGTSGDPRPIGLTYGNHLWSAVGSAFNLGVDPGDRWLCCLPLHHVAGLQIVMRSVIYGTGAIVHDGFDAASVATSLERQGVSLVSLVTTQLSRLLEERIDLSGPRAILIGGGPVPREVLEEAIARGVRRWSRPTGSPRRRPRSRPSPPTTRGESSARRAGRFSRPTCGSRTARSSCRARWWRRDAPTRTAGCTPATSGRIDDEGFLYVEDRLGDVIVSGGENVLPAEVEEVLLSHPDVADAAAVGRADPEWQEAVVAVVVLRDGVAVDAEELRRHCAASSPPTRFRSGSNSSPSCRAPRRGS